MQGVRHFQSGQFDHALRRFQKAVAVRPEDADAHYNMAATLHRMGVTRNDTQMLNQAETLYNRCLDIDANHADAHRGLAVLLVETDRSDRAFVLLQNWARSSPQEVDAQVELARLYEEFGDRSTAELYLKNAVAVDHQDARAWSALGHLREDSGQLAQAIQNYERSYQLNRLQPKMAEHIASLNRTLQHQNGIRTAPSNTRVVTSPVNTVPTTRY